MAEANREVKTKDRYHKLVEGFLLSYYVSNLQYRCAFKLQDPLDGQACMPSAFRYTYYMDIDFPPPHVSLTTFLDYYNSLFKKMFSL